MFNTNRGEYGKEAENFALNFLKENGYDAIPTKQYLEEKGEKWTAKKDAELGDIQILKNGELYKSVDVKRADAYQPLDFVGTVAKRPCSDKFRENPDAWYLLYNKNLTKKVWVKADKLTNPKNGKFWTTKELLILAE